MEQVKCFIPETLEEALRIRKETGATILAGGSDLMVANSMGAGVTPAFKGDVLIITNLKELKGIRALPDGSVEIGACTTSAEIARSPIAPELLKDAASRMGAIALRNSATIGGNIGNASPKGDMPQPLILMDAEVVLTSVDGERRMLVDDYIIATKKTALREDEIITKVIIPKQDFTHIFFRKIGMRRANAISKLTLSAAATVRDGVVVDFRASSGAAGPKIARSRKAGHFVIVKVGEKGERIPLTIAGADTEKGTITLVIQAVGGSSRKICELNEGDYITDVVGPLGQATHIEKVGTVVCAGGGVGVAPLLPIVEAFHKAGNRVIVVLAARTKDLVILEEQMRQNSDEVIIMTDDGSYGMKGLVTNGVESVINRERVDLCVTIGPAIMMKFVSALTKKYEIPTVASLNTIMVDGTGMCGACRITVGGKTKFVCVDGPEFDAHQVDFDEMIMRLGAYKDIEKK